MEEGRERATEHTEILTQAISMRNEGEWRGGGREAEEMEGEEK